MPATEMPAGHEVRTAFYARVSRSNRMLGARSQADVFASGYIGRMPATEMPAGHEVRTAFYARVSRSNRMPGACSQADVFASGYIGRMPATEMPAGHEVRTAFYARVSPLHTITEVSHVIYRSLPQMASRRL